ncbi:DUF6292 family protein [Amycolatopsis sp. NPDC005232]|uniref:DUF6292 family protein n=1 Tax=Amycolatopsis sp. NPDC005232 TaxID=3157027 RepID=UPI0033A1D375
MWDEERRWAAAIETRSGEDLIVVRYLGTAVAPQPAEVGWFRRRRAQRRPRSARPTRCACGARATPTSSPRCSKGGYGDVHLARKLRPDAARLRPRASRRPARRAARGTAPAHRRP